MSKNEPPRARRRRLTRRVATRRLSDRLTFVFGGEPPADLTAGVFTKRTALGCNCRKRTHGRPRVACGMCGIGDRERVYRWRNQVRELRGLARGFQHPDWDSDFVATLLSPRVAP